MSERDKSSACGASTSSVSPAGCHLPRQRGRQDSGGACGAYILGSGRAPDWLKERMMLYLRPDGAVGYEIFGRYRNWTAQKGDTVTRTESGDVRVIPRADSERGGYLE